MLARRTLLSFPSAYWLMRGSPLSAASLSRPGGGSSQTTPKEAGWDPALASEAQRYCASVGTAAFVAIRNGVVVDRWGDISRKLEIHSVRKSLLSALIGIAVAEGRMNLDATLDSLGIDDVPPALTKAEKQATVRQLLQARSGIYHVALSETEDERALRPARGSHAPGTFWYYNNWDFNVLGTIYERATGTSIFDSFYQRIALPIGMQDYEPRDGHYIRGPESLYPAYPFRMTARDLARFGLLYLRSGRWRDEHLVPAAWVRDSTSAWSLTYEHSGYGYMWWTGFPYRRVHVMDLSPGGFWADGHNGQYIVVDPVNDLVVVHQTDTRKVGRRQMGHLMWLLLSAAHADDNGPDPLSVHKPSDRMPGQ